MEVKALNLLEAENKLAALPASSQPSERRLLFTPVLQTMLLEDNTFRDIKMFPAAYRLSPYWQNLDWQNRAKATQDPCESQRGFEQREEGTGGGGWF